MSDLVVIAFPTEAKAEEVRQKLLAMQKDDRTEGCGEGQRWKCQTQPNAQHHCFGCGIWSILGNTIGLIFLMPLAGAALGAASGSLAGYLRDVGIDDRWMKETAEAIKPRTAALFVLARKVTADKVLDGLKGEGGTVLKTSLDHTKKAAVQAALAGVQAAVPSSSAAAS